MGVLFFYPITTSINLGWIVCSLQVADLTQRMRIQQEANRNGMSQPLFSDELSWLITHYPYMETSCTISFGHVSCTPISDIVTDVRRLIPSGKFIPTLFIPWYKSQWLHIYDLVFWRLECIIKIRTQIVLPHQKRSLLASFGVLCVNLHLVESI